MRLIKTLSAAALVAAIAVSGLTVAAPTATADAAEDRAAAISACRAEVAEQLGLANVSAVEFDQSRTRGGRVDVVLQVTEGEAAGRYACRYSRSQESVTGIAAGTSVREGDTLTAALTAAS